MAERKTPHLSDLFKTGKEVKLTVELDGKEQEIIIWMRKPLPAQHQEAMNKARGKQARLRRRYKDQESDEYLALEAEADQFDETDDLMTAILQFENQRLRTQSYNDVLYDPDVAPKDDDGEWRWGQDGSYYLEMLMGLGDRLEEIRKFNDELDEGDQHLRIIPAEDEELVALEKQQKEMEDTVDVRFEELNEVEKSKLRTKKVAELRKILMKKLIDAETSMTWYEEYRMWMLYFSCRESTDHSELYFRDPDDVSQLPNHLVNYLYEALDELDTGADSKNLPSLQLS